MTERVPVLCWGGPQHGEVVWMFDTDREVKFPVQRRLSPVPVDYANPSAHMATVLYHMWRYAFRLSEYHVLVYGENEERLMRNFEATAATVLWLCGWTLEPREVIADA